MWGWLGKALSPLLLGSKTGAASRNGREAAIVEAQAKLRDVMTPERAELIRQAMAVRKAKQTVLANLSDEQRQRLVAAAMKRLLNEGRDG